MCWARQERKRFIHPQDLTNVFWEKLASVWILRVTDQEESRRSNWSGKGSLTREHLTETQEKFVTG